MTEPLKIFSAGVAAGLVKQIAAEWQAKHPECPVSMEMGGSVDLIQRARAGEPCDLLILADDTKDEKGETPKRKGPPRKPLSCDMDLLELSGEMVTKYYDPEVAEAQGIMLRNFLGILAQKVCDVREENHLRSIS